MTGNAKVAPRDQTQPAQQPLIGTESKPAVVQIAKSKEETAQEQQDRDNEASAKRWTMFLAGLTILVGLGEIGVVLKQAAIAAQQNTIIGQQNTIMEGQRTAANAQSDYMRDGLIETRKAADATMGQLKLAAATYLDLKGLTVERHLREDGTLKAVTVGYKLTNMSTNVARKIAVSKRFALKGRPLQDDTPFMIDVLPPGKAFLTSVRIDGLDAFHVELLNEGMFRVVFHLMASWIDPLDHETTRRFARMVTLSHLTAHSTYLSGDTDYQPEDLAY